MKKLIALLLSLVMLLSLAACSKDDTSKNDDDDKESTSQNESKGDKTTEPGDADGDKDETKPTEETGLRSEAFVIPETADACDGTVELTSRNCNQVAMNFVEAIAKNYYASAVNAFDIENSPFITSEDIAYAVPRSAYRNIAKYAGKEVYLFVDEDDTSTYDDSATVKVQLRSVEEAILHSFIVRLELNKSNKWTIQDRDFYETDCIITVSGNTTLYIDGVEVSKELIEEHAGYGALKDSYRIPLIGKGTKTLRIACDAFDTETQVEPKSNNDDEPIGFSYILTDAELNDALNATKTLWESLYSDYINGVPAQEWGKYFAGFAPNVNVDDIKSSFDNLTEDNSGHHISLIQKRSDADCFYITDNVIVMNVQYQMDSVWDLSGWTQSGRIYSHILLAVENGQYKIYEVSDMKFFQNGDGNDW